jgi:hypothetical protein
MYPNPKDYHKFEDLMIAYSKAYGANEAIGKINQFMLQQEQIVKDQTKMLNDQESEY